MTAGNLPTESETTESYKELEIAEEELSSKERIKEKIILNELKYELREENGMRDVNDLRNEIGESNGLRNLNLWKDLNVFKDENVSKNEIRDENDFKDQEFKNENKDFKDEDFKNENEELKNEEEDFKKEDFFKSLVNDHTEYNNEEFNHQLNFSNSSDPVVVTYENLYRCALEDLRKMDFQKLRGKIAEMERIQSHTPESYVLQSFIDMYLGKFMDSHYKLKKILFMKKSKDIIALEAMAHWNFSAKYYDLALHQYSILLKENISKGLKVLILARVALGKKNLGDLDFAEDIIDTLLGTPEGYRQYMYFMVEKIHINIMKPNNEKALELFGMCGGVRNYPILQRLYAFYLYTFYKIPEIFNFCAMHEEDSYCQYVAIRTAMENPNFDFNLPKAFANLLYLEPDNIPIMMTYANHLLLLGHYSSGMKYYSSILERAPDFSPGIRNYNYLMTVFNGSEDRSIYTLNDSRFHTECNLVDIDLNPEYLGFYKNDLKGILKEVKYNFSIVNKLEPLEYEHFYPESAHIEE